MKLQFGQHDKEYAHLLELRIATIIAHSTYSPGLLAYALFTMGLEQQKLYDLSVDTVEQRADELKEA